MTATYKLEIALDEAVAGVFTVDGSALDGTDGLADTSLSDGTYTDISGDAQDPYQVVIGTDNLMSSVQASNLTVTVGRVDDPGYWNPANPSSPLASDTPGLVPMRPIRLTALVEQIIDDMLTVSGNEITDALRTAQGPVDGFYPGHGAGVGVWPAHTNSAVDTACSGTTTLQIGGGGAASVDSTTANPFPAHMWWLLTGPSSADVLNANAYQPAAAAGQSWTFSVWVQGVAGQAVRIWMLGMTSGHATNTDAPFKDYVLTGNGPQRLTLQATLADATTAFIKWTVQMKDGTGSLRVTAPMLAKMAAAGQVLDLPYVANTSTTAGSTATRGASNVQAPSSLLNPTQGWVAISFVANDPGSDTTNNPGLFGWTDGTSHNGVYCYWHNGSIHMYRAAAASSSNASVPATWNAGDTVTVVCAWDANNVYVSVNGAAFTQVANTYIPTGLGSTFDIGDLQYASSAITSRIQWFGCGTGALSNLDVAWLQAQLTAGTQPTIPSIDTTDLNADCAAAWDCVTADYQAETLTDLPVFTGYTRRGNWDSTSRCIQLYCEDFLLWASRVYPVISETGPIYMGDAFRLLVATVDATLDPVTDKGILLPTFSADGTLSVTDILSNLLAVDLGTAYVARDGTPVYRQADYEFAAVPAATITITEQTSEEQTGFDVDDIGTRIVVEQLDDQGNPVQAYSQIDEQAELTYGRSDLNGISSSYVGDPRALATEAVLRGVQGKPPLDFTLADVDDDTLLLILQSTPGTVYTIDDPFAGTSGDGIAQRIQHTIQTGLHEAEFLLAARGTDVSIFTVDGSALDGTDQLRYP